MKNRNKQSGFSLLELMVVLLIIGLVAAIAIPRLVSARNSASETNALASMRSANTSLQMYASRWNSYPATFDLLGGDCSASPATASSACVIDDTIGKAIAAGPYNNYTWTYTPTTNGFTLLAVPATGNGAVREFFLTEGGVIHYSDSATPTLTSAVIGN